MLLIEVQSQQVSGVSESQKNFEVNSNIIHSEVPFTPGAENRTYLLSETCETVTLAGQ